MPSQRIGCVVAALVHHVRRATSCTAERTSAYFLYAHCTVSATHVVQMSFAYRPHTLRQPCIERMLTATLAGSKTSNENRPYYFEIQKQIFEPARTHSCLKYMQQTL